MFLLIIMTNLAHARQYIQCALGTSDQRVVLNLDGVNSTYYFVNGVHLPDPVTRLKGLKFVGSNSKVHVFKTEVGNIREVAYIPSEYIDRAVSYMEVVIKQFDLVKKRSVKRRWGCFSSIH